MKELLLLSFVIISYCSFSQSDEYVMSKGEALDYIRSEMSSVESFEVDSIEEMDDGWYCTVTIEGQKAELYFMDSQDSRIDVYYLP